MVLSWNKCKAEISHEGENVMPLEIQTALISAAVAIITVAIGGFLTWNQIQRERRRWLTDLKTAYSMELHKTRLDSYPRVYEIF